MYVALNESDFMALIMESIILWVVPVIYQGLIDLTEKISNPFSGDEIDFPGEMYQKALLGQCNEFIEVRHFALGQRHFHFAPSHLLS